MPKKANEDDEVDLEKLAKVMDFIKSGEFQKIVQDFMAGDSEKYKDLANLRNMFASKVFDWDNDQTKKPARDAFLNLTKGYDQLSKTFNPQQKEIAEQTDFKENVTELVLSMREQIEHFKRDAKEQSKRFWISTAIAIASMGVTVVIAVVAMII